MGHTYKLMCPQLTNQDTVQEKNVVATNVLGVCAPDMQFSYVLLGWEGSAADGRVVHDYLSRPNGFKVSMVRGQLN